MTFSTLQGYFWVLGQVVKVIDRDLRSTAIDNISAYILSQSTRKVVSLKSAHNVGPLGLK